MIGVDLIQNKRIGEAVERFGEKFLKRVYTEKELEYCNNQKAKIPCLAARWACKEAVIKAVFQETGMLLKFKEIEVNGRTGFPAKVTIKNEKVVKMLGEKTIIVSLSHERDHSVAIALIR